MDYWKSSMSLLSERRLLAQVVREAGSFKDELSKAEMLYQGIADRLGSKQSDLEGTSAELSTLEDELREVNNKSKQVETEQYLCSSKIERAERLLGGLVLDRDESAILGCEREGTSLLSTLVGDALTSAAVIAYLGPFSPAYRDKLRSKFAEVVQSCGLASQRPWSLIDVVMDCLPIQACIPPALHMMDDAVFVENAISMSVMGKPSLCIDPQGQAARWIRECNQNIQVCKVSDSEEYLQVIDQAARLWATLLWWRSHNEIDARLHPFLLAHTSRGACQTKRSKPGMNYKDGFKLYLVTAVPNPNYSLEVAAQVNVLDFAITPNGLVEQIVGVIFSTIKPESHKMRFDIKARLSTSQAAVREGGGADSVGPINHKIRMYH
eukprot:jgi/Botrbrau1/8169/Bobra.357_2s0015.1